jgi:hypothetical protein
MIYHLAGNALWELTPQGQATDIVKPINRVKNAQGAWEPRPSTSGISYEVINGEPTLFFGTGENLACSFRLNSRLLRCVPLTGNTTADEPIVTVPLVLKTAAAGREVDIIVMGDKRGQVHVIQGLAAAESLQEVRRHAEYVGGWVLASPVPVDEGRSLSFVWGSDLGGQGTIGAFRITPASGMAGIQLEKLWADVDTFGGIADGFAKDGDYIYAVDVEGNFYRVHAAFPNVEVVKYGQDTGLMFANAAPAVDDKHIYFSIRNVGTSGPSTDAPGRLIALNKHPFTLEGGWTANLPAPANTNPLVWTAGPNVVLVGDTKGVLHAFDRETGQPKEFALETAGQTPHGDICTPINRLDLGAPDQAGQAYQTLTGISEPIIASGSTGQALLLVGVSGLKNGELSGSLKAFRAGGAYNVAWSQPRQPEVALAVGQAHTVSDQLTIAPWGGAPRRQRQVGLEAWWVPDPSTGGTVRRLDRSVVTVDPDGAVPVSVTFTPIEADGAAGSVQWFVNPEQLAFSGTEQGRALRQAASLGEGDAARAVEYVAGGQYPGNCEQGVTELLPEGPEAAMADNLLMVPVRIEQVVDLSVISLRAPGAVACQLGSSITATWVVRNPSGRTLKGVPFALWMTSSKLGYPVKSVSGVLDLPPGDTPFTGPVSLGYCGDSVALRIEVNLGPEPRPVREPDFANNVMGWALTVAGQAEGPAIRSMGGGGVDVLIVPDDCVSNPDLTSRQPCLNYPNLIMP